MTIEKLISILLEDKPSDQLRKFEIELFELIPELKRCKGFNQHNVWHVYDVYDHILCVVDNTPNDIVLRLSALFHDVGKPTSFTKDESGNGHFYGHWSISKQIFDRFAKENSIPDEIVNKVEKLIIYHDTRFERLDDKDLRFIVSVFSESEMKDLFALKRADLLGQNEKFHYLLDDYERQEKEILNMYKGSDKNEYAIFTRSKKKNK